MPSPGGDTRRVRHGIPWVAWWFALFWLWLLLAGEWNREQLVAAAIAAMIAAFAAEFARSRTGFAAPLPLRVLAELPQALGMVTQGPGPRAWTVLLASYSPNAFVVDVDLERRRVLLHDLVRNRRSEGPV